MARMTRDEVVDAVLLVGENTEAVYRRRVEGMKKLYQAGTITPYAIDRLAGAVARAAVAAARQIGEIPARMPVGVQTMQRIKNEYKQMIENDLRYMAANRGRF